MSRSNLPSRADDIIHRQLAQYVGNNPCTFTLASEVRGAVFRPGGKSAAMRLVRTNRNRQPLFLCREPDNCKDKDAIMATDITGEFVGYIAREHAPVVGVLLDAGIDLICLTDCFPKIILYIHNPYFTTENVNA